MKKLLAMIMLVCMFALGLAGCGGSNSEVTEPCLTFDAYGNGCLIVEESDGEGGTVTSETGSYTFTVLEGETVGDVLDAQGVKSMKPELRNDTFEGWMEFKEIITTDKDGFETREYERLSGDTLYTTQEVMERPLPEYPVSYVAKWASIPMEDYFVVEVIPDDISLTFEGCDPEGTGIVTVTAVGDGGNKSIEEFNAIGYLGEQDDIIADVLEEEDVTSIVPSHDSAEFEGWMEFKEISYVDEEGYDCVKYERVSDSLYTTDEVMQRTLPDYNVVYIAKWSGFEMDEYYAE